MISESSKITPHWNFTMKISQLVICFEICFYRVIFNNMLLRLNIRHEFGFKFSKDMFRWVSRKLVLLRLAKLAACRSQQNLRVTQRIPTECDKNVRNFQQNWSQTTAPVTGTLLSYKLLTQLNSFGKFSTDIFTLDIKKNWQKLRNCLNFL